MYGHSKSLTPGRFHQRGVSDGVRDGEDREAHSCPGLAQLFSDYPTVLSYVQSVTLQDYHDHQVGLTLSSIMDPPECIKGFVPRGSGLRRRTCPRDARRSSTAPRRTPIPGSCAVSATSPAPRTPCAARPIRAVAE